MRHGQSTWNLENRFTGWTDVDLTDLGVEEARRAGELIQQSQLEFDIVYTSFLQRAIKTAYISLDVMEQLWLPMIKDWRLNERHYGDLQGLNKAETAVRFGEQQVHLWRRSFDIPPPALLADDLRHPSRDPRYAKIEPSALPNTESLKDTIHRVLPFWNTVVVPAIESGRRVLVVAHGNSLRALCKYLDNLTDEEIVDLNIPTGKPLVYELDSKLQPIRHYYL